MDVANLRENLLTWDAIAHSFDATRRSAWPPVVEFLESLSSGALVLDAGTGNGRHAAAAAQAGLRVVGADLSQALLRTARIKEPRARFVQGALERLPLRSSVFDAAIAIATIHHVRGRGNRLEAWTELRRILRPGAPLLASAWARDQSRFENLARSLEPAPPLEAGDVLVWWTQHGLRVPRYYHLYEGPELESEARDAGLEIERRWSPKVSRNDDSANHFLLARRPTSDASA